MTIRSSRSAEGSRRGRLLWLTGLVIFAALALVVWTQVRQFHLLNRASEYQDDYSQVSLGTLESEYLRLRLAWGEAMNAVSPDRDALQLRYDIFVSRVALLDTERARATVRRHGDNEASYRKIKGFIAEADVVLGAGAAAPDRATLTRLCVPLDAIAEPVHSMVIEGSHHLAGEITQRTVAMRETNRNTLLLTVFLALAAFGFALLSLSQFRRLDMRRRSLEAVSDDLRQAQRLAEEASVAKSNFLANMSHEIRTPLQGVLGMLALLADSPLDRQQQSRLQTARSSADHLLAILNDILDLAKLEAGKLAMAPQRVDLPRLLTELDALMRAQATAKGLELRVEMPADLPRWVELDPTRVRQILLNLCSNAIKFTAQGRVIVNASTSDDRLWLSVEDTGIGIDAATLTQLFQRFGRGDDTRARRHGGTGLGLEISRQLARRMGGDIDVTSKPGAGSRFVVELPLVEVPAPAVVTPAAAVPVAAGAMPSRLVLVADDNAVNREYTGAVLDQLGHRVVYAMDGAEAVAVARDLAVDLVLMDLHMPGVDGLDATRAIRLLDDRQQSQVRIVALTADAFADTRETCLAAGMDDFVTKPVSPTELAQVLEHLGPAGSGAAGRALDLMTSPVDRQTLLDPRILSDVMRLLPAAKLQALADRFATEARDSLDRMQDALTRVDLDTLDRSAHSFKGMAAALGLKALADAAAQLQESAMAADASDRAVGSKLHALQQLLDPSHRALRETVAGVERP